MATFLRIANFLMKVPYHCIGIFFYIRNDIPSNIYAIETKSIESFCIKLNLRDDKWLLNCSRYRHKSLIHNQFEALSKCLDFIFLSILKGNNFG